MSVHVIIIYDCNFEIDVYDILSRALSESEHVVILHIKYVRNKLVSNKQDLLKSGVTVTECAVTCYNMGFYMDIECHMSVIQVN